MAQLGSLVLFIALILSVYSLAASILGVRKDRPQLVDSARYATYFIPFCLLIAVMALMGAFVSHDFQIRYVAEHSSRAMAPQYTWVAFYAGNEGSLLYIAFALAVFAALAIFKSPARTRETLPYVISVIMLILTFFLAIMIFLANPFSTLTVPPVDGRGVNPLLTHPGMFIHPPVMMAGLIAVTIPFAYATGSLLAGKTGDEWVTAGRIWGLIAWVLLGSGLLLGAWWAYTILGWGGYWAWDPVENAGLMPWLGLTAFVHSIMIQARRGMFRMWNILLINITFVLASFGMFINRGGPVPSVHSFGQSSLGWMFLVFLGVVALLSFVLFFYRYSTLKSTHQLESTLSREAAFLLNNLILLFVAFVTLWGVVFPLFAEVIDGETVTVAAPFYNRINGPLLLALIFLMGVGPLVPWRKTTLRMFGKTLLFPFAVVLTTTALLYIGGIRYAYPLLAYGICAFVLAGILREWFRGTRSRHVKGESYPLAFIRLIASNRPRYGGYIAHIAILMLALGITGSSFYSEQKDVVLSRGDSVEIGDYRVRFEATLEEAKGDRLERTAIVAAFKDERLIGTMDAIYNFYPSFRMASTRSAIHSTPVEDLYIIPREFLDDGRVGFRILLNPLVWWMWVSGPVLLLGTLIALIPGRRQTRAKASEVETMYGDS